LHRKLPFVSKNRLELIKTVNTDRLNIERVVIGRTLVIDGSSLAALLQCAAG